MYVCINCGDTDTKITKISGVYNDSSVKVLSGGCVGDIILSNVNAENLDHIIMDFEIDPKTEYITYCNCKEINFVKKIDYIKVIVENDTNEVVTWAYGWTEGIINVEYVTRDDQQPSPTFTIPLEILNETLVGFVVDIGMPFAYPSGSPSPREYDIQYKVYADSILVSTCVLTKSDTNGWRLVFRVNFYGIGKPELQVEQDDSFDIGFIPKEIKIVVGKYIKQKTFTFTSTNPDVLLRYISIVYNDNWAEPYYNTDPKFETSNWEDFDCAFISFRDNIGTGTLYDYRVLNSYKNLTYFHIFTHLHSDIQLNPPAKIPYTNCNCKVVLNGNILHDGQIIFIDNYCIVFEWYMTTESVPMIRFYGNQETNLVINEEADDFESLEIIITPTDIVYMNWEAEIDSNVDGLIYESIPLYGNDYTNGIGSTHLYYDRDYNAYVNAKHAKYNLPLNFVSNKGWELMYVYFTFAFNTIQTLQIDTYINDNKINALSGQVTLSSSYMTFQIRYSLYNNYNTSEGDWNTWSLESEEDKYGMIHVYPLGTLHAYNHISSYTDALPKSIKFKISRA